jgi:hypothetical protein
MGVPSMSMRAVYPFGLKRKATRTPLIAPDITTHARLRHKEVFGSFSQRR